MLTGRGIGGDLTGYVLTSTNTGGGSNPDLNDNDASIVSMVPTITYTTGGGRK